MSDLVSGILSRIETGLPEEVDEAAAEAVSLFELARGSSPFIPEMEAAPGDLREEKLAALVTGLVSAIEADPVSSFAGPLVWALGKRFDAALRPFLLRVLEANLEGNPHVLHQTLVALSNLEEPALMEVEFLSIHDQEENQRLARTILGR